VRSQEVPAVAESADRETVGNADEALGPPPRHVAIIMDGNGRWAQNRSRPRSFGHREGVEALRRTVEIIGDYGVKYLTVYGFSTENWRRPPEEVDALLELLRHYVGRDLERLERDGVNVRIVGERFGLAPDIADIIDRAQQRTLGNSKLYLTIAFNYGARAEILRAVRAIAEQAAADGQAPVIDEAAFAARLDTAGAPDPDLVIRTSGEQRMSNFLLWQAAYAELLFLDVLWPDFDRAALEQAIDTYRRRDRRFGGAARDATA
jgi:undecaprenyl diphosphate synthase